jgi:hypothetical protein
MSKPFSIAALLEKVRDLLRQGVHSLDARPSEGQQAE